MPELPENARNLAGYEAYGVDENGLYVHFGFKFADGGAAVIHCDHLMLGQTVLYLQAVAKEAQQRRLIAQPGTEDLEAQGRPYNPVVTVDFDVDVTGQSIAMLCATQDGVQNELQMPFDLVEKMYAGFAGPLNEARRRQRAHGQQH